MKWILAVCFQWTLFSVSALTVEQKQFQSYYKKALNGDQAALASGKNNLSNYILVHYLDYAFLRSQMSQLPITEIENFISNHPKSPLNSVLQNMLAYELGRQKKWSEFLKYYKPASPTSKSHCWYLNAKIETGQTQGLQFAVQNTWLNGLSLPSSCDPVFEWFENQGYITDELIEKRIKMAFEVNNASTARYLASKLSQKPHWIEQAMSLMNDPMKALEDSLNWADEDTTKRLVLSKANSLAAKNPKDLYPLWQKIKKHFSYTELQYSKVDRTLALFAATDYLSFTIKAMDDLPPEKYDSQIQAWKVRYHLFHGHWKEVKTTIEKMPEFQRKKDTWQYWLARALAKTGQPGSAKRIFSKLAKNFSYYGFLAADHMRLPYQVCSMDIPASPITQMPIELDRAFELFELNMITEARAEWTLGYNQLNRNQRRTLADLALQKGWYNKAAAISGALGLWNNFKLRFPLGYDQKISKHTKKHRISPQWIMSIIKQESAWQTDAISKADARGLMQIIGPTAKRLAKQLGLNYLGKHQLHEANFNLNLGIYYQRLLLDQFNNHPLLALSAYNAGERKAEDWLQGFPTSPDIWAETIPYLETRDYIKKILTNVTIYDWVVNQKPQRLSSWMPTLPVDMHDVKAWPNSKVSKQLTSIECDS